MNFLRLVTVAALFSLLSACLPASCQQPSPTIEAVVTPPSKKYTVELTATVPPEGATVFWVCFPRSNVETIGERKPEKWVFAAPVGTYEVQRITVTKDGQSDLVKIVKVGDNPNPEPDNPPTPDSTAKTLATKWAESVTSPNKSAEAVALAKSFDAVAMRIEGGEWKFDGDFVTNRQACKSALRTLNQAAIGASRENWLPWFLENQKYLDEFDKKASGLPEYAKLWREQAAGLREVK